MKFLRDIFGMSSAPTPKTLGKALWRELMAEKTDVPKCIALVEQGADVNMIRNDQSILEKSLSHNVKLLKTILTKNPDIDWQDKHSHDTAVHLAIRWNHHEHTILLIEAGANIDLLNKDAVSPREMLGERKNAKEWMDLIAKREKEKTDAQQEEKAPIDQTAPIPVIKKTHLGAPARETAP